MSGLLILWFFRDLTDEQRLSLFRTCGLLKRGQEDQAGSMFAQKKLLHHILAAQKD